MPEPRHYVIDVEFEAAVTRKAAAEHVEYALALLDKVLLSKDKDRGPMDDPHPMLGVRFKVFTAYVNGEDQGKRGKCRTRNKLGRVRPYNNGHNNPLAKLTQAQCLEIYHRVEAGEKQIALAVEFGVHNSTVGRAVRRVEEKLKKHNLLRKARHE